MITINNHLNEVGESKEAYFTTLKKFENKGLLTLNQNLVTMNNGLAQILSNVEQKRSTLWIHGVPNSGKSTFIRTVKQIFSCVQISFKTDNFQTIDKQINPQIILIDEISFENFFS